MEGTFSFKYISCNLFHEVNAPSILIPAVADVLLIRSLCSENIRCSWVSPFLPCLALPCLAFTFCSRGQGTPESYVRWMDQSVVKQRNRDAMYTQPFQEFSMEQSGGARCLHVVTWRVLLLQFQPQRARPDCNLLQVCGANIGYYLHMGTARRRSVETTRAK